LNLKGAKVPFEVAWVDRLNRLEDREGPIALSGPDGELWRLWPGQGTGDPRHWRLFVKGVRDSMIPPPPRKAKKASAPRGFKVRICIENETELQILGCGWRTVTIELDGPNVRLHHHVLTATMKRKAFKEFVAANKRVRRKNPTLRLAVSGPRSTVKAPAPPLPTQATYVWPTHHDDIPRGPTPGALQADDYPIGTDPDGNPVMPACLRRAPHLKLVVDNTPTNAAKEEAA
jgi:hypothetical protein